MKTIVWAVGAIVVLAAGCDDRSDATTFAVQTGEHASTGDTKAACDIFTEDIAVQILGAGATKGEVPGTAITSTDDLSMTHCLYSFDDPDSMGVPTANVMVRGGKTDLGKISNRSGFEDGKALKFEGYEATPGESISGLGDDAYFSPDLKQVNVLVDDGTYWLIVGGDSRAQSEKLARLLVEEL